MSEEYYAHSLEGEPPPKWQKLEDHLRQTAKLAEQFASEFGSGGWGYLAGLWHDLGKYSSAFQRKITSSQDAEAHIEARSRVDHSTAGALYAIQQFEIAGRIFAYIAAGHHAGLADWEADQTGNASLSQRTINKELLQTVLTANIPTFLLERDFPEEKPIGHDPAFWIRLLFSCVVDADFLDTESFINPKQSLIRGGYPSLETLLSSFFNYMNEKQVSAPVTKVNEIRADVLSRCEKMAVSPPGVFSLTVPTGGGKTLSSMAFALRHAAAHSLRRIIYVIPYTSIIEQTADQFRQIFGDAIIEHHSNLEVTDEAKETIRSRLACENWDAPVVVTTSVQFFESLFANRPSRCRKLHNIVGSVVILDEVQLLPPEFLKPILRTLDELRKNYHVTLLLSTATQPAFAPHDGPGFKFEGLSDVQEIMEDPEGLYAILRRVEINVPKSAHEPIAWEELAEELSSHSSVLCVVSRRDDCRKLWSLMPEGTIHLSALMCGAHRSKKIEEIKKRLHLGLPIRVISTQLVEAGVDVDFPVVYRAMAGLDSIAQAAGRCNREGLIDMGMVKVFVPPTQPPVGVLRQAAEIGSRLLSECEGDPLAPHRFTDFFKQLYWLQGDQLDKHDICDDLQMSADLRCSFRSAASKFKIIDDHLQAPVIVSYGDKGRSLINQLNVSGPERWLLRQLQRYVVNLPIYEHKRLLAEKTIREIAAGIYVQGHNGLYDDDIGFCADKSMIYNPDDLIA
jgi:CRISPR-associated endonuclease/helicase Cas3